MKKDFLRDLHHLGVTARLKRLSDSLSASIKALYREHNVDIEPSWHLVFLYLERYTQATITEIATALGISQPAMTNMITRMQRKGYLEVVRDSSDSRKKNARLSARARECLPALHRIWHAGQASIGEILEGNDEFIQNLEAFETQIHKKNFRERAMERLVKDPYTDPRATRSQR